MRRLGLLLLPVGVGLILAGLVQAGLGPNPILYARADVGSWLALLGLVGSLASGAGWVIWRFAWNRSERGQDQLSREQAEAHRRFVRRLDHEVKKIGRSRWHRIPPECGFMTTAQRTRRATWTKW